MKTAFLFPGQGSQTVGMGKELYNYYTIYKQTFDMCEQGSGLDLKAACFEGERMDESEVVQPAIFAHTISLLEVLRSKGVDADIYVGLSLGEYSALTAAEVFGIEQCAALVRQRGRIMDNAFPKGAGGMLSVIGFTVEQVEDVIKAYENVYVANHLSQLQTVVAGEIVDLLALQEVFTEKDAKMVTLLNVRGSSHAPLLNDAAQKFLDVLNDIEIGHMDKSVYSNVLGEPYAKDSNIKQLLAKQMCSRVRWYDCVENLIASGVERYVEVGPSNVLSKLVKRRVGKGISVTSVRDLATLDKFFRQYEVK